jgi:hypothetical protein
VNKSILRGFVQETLTMTEIVSFLSYTPYQEHCFVENLHLNTNVIFEPRSVVTGIA